MNLSQRIELVKEQTGLSDEGIAKVAGCTGTTVRRVRMGGDPSPLVRDALQKAIDQLAASGSTEAQQDIDRSDSIRSPQPTPAPSVRSSDSAVSPAGQPRTPARSPASDQTVL